MTGATGLIGTALSASLDDAGHEVVRFVRRSHGGANTEIEADATPNTATDTATDTTIEWDIAEQKLNPDQVASLDAVVHLAGAGIADHRWTPEYRRTLVDSRVDGTTLLAETMAQAGGPTTLISGSAIGYYGDRGNEVLTEASPAGTGFLPELCTAWEGATAPAAAAGLRVAMLRTGIVLSPAGGALRKMLPLFKLGLGGRFGSGQQWMSWITIDDQVRAIMHLITGDGEGPFNLTAPNPQTNQAFTAALANALSRPSKLPVPRFGPRLLLGRDLANNLLFDSQRVVPAALESAGFTFDFADLDTAFRHLL